MESSRLVLFCIVILWHTSLASENITTWHEMVRVTRQTGALCTVPSNPANGQYSIAGAPDATPGQTLPAIQLTVACDPGFRAKDREIVYCINGIWSDEVPQCVRHCRLDPHPSVRYHCPASSNGFKDGFRDCKLYEPTGTVVKPQCNSPLYYYHGVKTLMRCQANGGWDHLVFCTAECGLITPEGTPLILEGRTSLRGEFPWHAGVYLKPTGDGKEHKLVCGGSIISSKIIISAAHCFWTSGHVRPASTVAIAVGKLYSQWNHPRDLEAQTFDVTDIKIPVHYRGYATNYQADIAAVTLSAAIAYRSDVRPVCVDLNRIFDRTQLRQGAVGKVAGWGFTETGKPSSVLKVTDMVYIPEEQCIQDSPASFVQFLTNDKICAGQENGSTVCRGDSGGGLVFPAMDRGVERYYLRGIVSVAAETDQQCNNLVRAAFTRIIEHETFIEEMPAYINNQCVMPPYPAHGTYAASGKLSGFTNFRPGQIFSSFQITVNCDKGYVADGNSEVRCSAGTWSNQMPACINCGRVSTTTKLRRRRAIGGHTAAEGEVPWHAGIYMKDYDPKRQICGGSIVSPTVVISGAVCFWNDADQAPSSASKYAVAVGKLSRVWNDPTDTEAQKFEVSAIHIPSRYQGAAAHFQEDIALIRLSKAIEFNRNIQPVCLDFDAELEAAQLQPGNIGKVAGWGLTSQDGTVPSHKLQVVALPYVDIPECLARAPPSFREYITSDKICAGFDNGTAALCKGDSGEGLVFPDEELGVERYYLRGLVSISPNADGHVCNAKAITGFTQISKHQSFIKKYLNDETDIR